MVTTAEHETVQTIRLVRETLIAAPLDIAFEAVLEELGPAGETPDGKSLEMVIEPWVGGRWFRDLGNGVGHLWGHVQVIKPPRLIEICGPMFMSYACMNHVQYRLAAEGDRTRLTLTHCAIGQIPEQHRQGVSIGWDHALGIVRRLAESRGRDKSQVSQT